MYGARKVWLALNREGIAVARCTVERLMAELGLTGAVRGKAKRTTIADPTAARPADLVQRRFAPPAPNRLWVADLTYVSTWSGFAYVAFVVDAYARRILGWRVASTMATSMVLDAIEQAIWTRQREGVFDLKDVVHHTDRGSQYTSIRFTERLAEAGIQPSVGAVGSSYDNALAETINGLYKTELIKPASRGAPSRRSNWPPPNGSTGLDMRVIFGVFPRSCGAGRGCCGGEVVVFVPCLVRPVGGGGVPRLGHRLLDDYLEMVAARARPNTVLATAFDLKVFFTQVAKVPEEVTGADVLSFIAAQRQPRRGAEVVRIQDGEAGLSARTIKRRLASVTGLFEYLIVRGVVSRNPVPQGLSTRSPSRAMRGVPLIRTPRTLPRVIDPEEADALIRALRTHRDRAMVQAMLLGGLRRCEVLGLRLGDVHPGEKRLFIADGKGGHQRIVPVSPRFFTTLASYLELERPGTASTDRVFVVLKGRRRGWPLSAAGLDEVIAGARRRAGIEHLTCHQLRHTCFTRLREAGMALEAIQAQAGHRSIESTRIYLHLANDWLAGEYRRAVEAIDAQAMQAP